MEFACSLSTEFDYQCTVVEFTSFKGRNYDFTALKKFCARAYSKISQSEEYAHIAFNMVKHILKEVLRHKM